MEERTVMDMLDKIIAFECGEMDEDEIINLFSELISTGQAWNLQGAYGRKAESFIENGIISESGEILTEDDVEGCSCGMADYGEPGHDGSEV